MKTATKKHLLLRRRVQNKIRTLPAGPNQLIFLLGRESNYILLAEKVHRICGSSQRHTHRAARNPSSVQESAFHRDEERK